MPIGIYKRKKKLVICSICGKKMYRINQKKNTKCKECYVKRNKVKVSRESREKQKTKDNYNRGNRTEQSKRYRKKHHEKFVAHGIVSRAKQKGILIKPKYCAMCGIETSELEAHHDDYSKPLEVQWICRKCHRKI